MKKLYSPFPRKIALAQVAAATLFFNTDLYGQQMKYPAVSSSQTLNSSQTLDVAGKMQVSKEMRLLDDVYLEKLKDLALPATQDRLVLIDKFGKMKGGPPFESIPPGQGSGNGGGGNPNPQSCSNTFEWEKITGTADIYNCGFGNVGIGIPAPESLLHVRKPGYPSSSFPGSQGALFKVQQSDNTDWAAEIYNNGGGGKGLLIIADGASSDVPALKTQNISGDVGLAVNSDGRVGIGTVSPSQKLQVNGNIKINDYYDLLLRNSHHGLGWYGNPFSENKRFVLANQSENIDGPVLYGFSGGALGAKYFYSDGQGGTIEAQNIALHWTANGSVGIGMLPGGAYKLDVAGVIRSRGPGDNHIDIESTTNGSFLRLMAVNSNGGVQESHIQFRNLLRFIEPLSGITRATIDANGFHACKVKVEVLAGCDFVFENDYALPSRKKRMDDILKYKHLPYIKPAIEMENDGLDVGETALGILRNVEEHELYLYNHDERIELLEKENKELRELIIGMKKEMEKLKKKK